MESSRNEIITQIVHQQELRDKIERQYYTENLYAFNRDIIRYPDLQEPLHRDMCNFVDVDLNKTRRGLMLIPRGHLKSSVITVSYCAQLIARNPNIRILIANATYLPAVSFLSQIKNILSRNEKYQSLFGDMSKGAQKWSENMITVNKGKNIDFEKKEATVTAYGMGGNLVSQHYDVIIFDDVVNRDTVSTKDQIEKTKIYYRDCLDLLEPGGLFLAIGTRWHFDDLYSWMIDTEEGLGRSFSTMVRQSYEGEFGRGQILFPKKFSWKHLEELKAQKGPYEFSAQYMNNPIDDDNADFKRSWFKYYLDDDIKGKKLSIFTICDPAISQKKEADFTAIITVGVDQFNNWFILDIVRDKLNPNQIIHALFAIDERFHPRTIGIEMVSFQKSLQYTLQDEMRKLGRFLPIKEIRPDSNEPKEMRIRGLQARYSNGSIFHNKQLMNVEFLEDELLRFPRGKHDDIADALAYIPQIAGKPKEKRSRQRAHYLY